MWIFQAYITLAVFKMSGSNIPHYLPGNVIVVPYDSASRYALTSNSLGSWKNILEKERIICVARELSSLIPYIIENEIKKIVYKNEVPLLIGGDHSLTYFSCKSLTSIYGPLNIVVFDAHHDSYPQIDLNHYTVFYHVEKNFRANIVRIGCRKDGTSPSDIDLSFIKSPCYISVDVDYFSPHFVPSVMDPVPCKNDNHYSYEMFIKHLSTLDCLIVGADIVEWGGAPAGSGEFNFIDMVYKALTNRLSQLSPPPQKD